MILIGRYETIRMSQQSTAGYGFESSATSQPTPLGFRYNPFMTSRAGFAYHAEYNWFHQDGTSPVYRDQPDQQ